MRKKILLVIDDEKREIDADYFDLNVSTGIGKGYDIVLSITSAIEGEQHILEPLQGSVIHPLKNAISTDLPSVLDFVTIGLVDSLKALRTSFGISFTEDFEKGAAIVSHENYKSSSYSISTPSIFETVLRDLIAWEKDVIKDRLAKVAIEPKVVFKNSERTEFEVVETLTIQTGVVEPLKS